MNTLSLSQSICYYVNMSLIVIRDYSLALLNFTNFHSNCGLRNYNLTWECEIVARKNQVQSQVSISKSNIEIEKKKKKGSENQSILSLWISFGWDLSFSSLPSKHVMHCKECMNQNDMYNWLSIKITGLPFKFEICSTQ